MVATDAILALLAHHLDAKALLDRAREEAASAVRLPIGDGDDLVDRGANLTAKQGEDLVLLVVLLGVSFAPLRVWAALLRMMRGAVVVLVGFLAMMDSLLIGRSGLPGFTDKGPDWPG